MKKKILILTLIIVIGFSTLAYSATKGFKDVKTGTWYYEYVIKASDKSFINGFKDGTFKPNDNVTRAHLAKIIVEYDNQVNTKVLNAIKDSSTDEQAIINAVANTIPSTVKVDSDGGYGSGFFVGENIVMTNAHVVGNSIAVGITVSTGEKLNGTVIAKDVAKDIALVKVNKHFTPLKFSTELRVGQNAIAIGNPLGMDQTVSKGIVSKLKVTDFKEASMFQMDTSVNSGNSGGVVVNTKGQVIGMATGKLLADGQIVEGIAFAIQSSELQKYFQLNVK